MALNFLLKRSGTASKRPAPASMSLGEIDLNYDSVTGGIYYKDSAGNAVKVGPCQVSATAPNSSPAGSAGNSAGEFWYDTSTNTLKVYSGTTWEETGGAVQGITVSSPLTVDNTDPLNPILGIDSASTTGAGAVQLDDTVTSTSTTEAATANAVKTAYDLADAALPKSGGTMTGDITFAGTQSFPVSGIADATTTTKGLVEIGTNIDVAAGVISVASASTTGAGIVQLNDTTSSTSTTEALTAAQGANLQSQIDALVITSNLTLAGTFDASTGLVDNVTAAGTAAGFAIGSPLPAAAAGNTDYFVIVDVEGSTGPSGTPPYHIGDWFLSDGTTWQFLNVGFQAAYASTTVAGVVELSTDAETQAGTDATLAVTPFSLQSKMSDSVSTVSGLTIASSTAVKDAYDAGIQGQTDAANAQATADAAMPLAGGIFTGNVDFQAAQLFTSTSTTDFDPGSIVNLNATTNVGGDLTINGPGSFGVSAATADFINGSIITVDNTSTLIIDTSPTWDPTITVGPALQVSYDNTSSGLTATEVQGAIDEIAGTASNALPLSGGTMTGVITFDITQTFPGTLASVTAAPGSAITVDNTDPANPVVDVDSASTLVSGVVLLNDTVTSTSTTEAATANAAKTAYDAGIQGQTDAAAAQTTADAAVPDSTFTAIGEVVVGTGAATYTVLSPGTSGQFLQSNGAGQQLTWEDVPASPTSSYTANKALTSATPVNLLEWDTGVRMGTLVVMATDNSTNHAWANISIGADTGIGTSAVTTQSTGVGTFAVIAGGGGETVVEFTPSVTLASVDFVYQYTAAFGAQPTVL